MTNTVVLDIEASGLDYKDPDYRIYCISVYSYLTNKLHTFDGCELRDGFDYLCNADVVIGHNIIGYDIPALFNYFGFDIKLWEDKGIFDTYTIASLIFADRSKQSLESWQEDAGIEKIELDFKSQIPLLEYIKRCENDVRITKWLYEHLQAQTWSQESIDLELQVVRIIKEQCNRGISFDEIGAIKLAAELNATKQYLLTEIHKLACTDAGEPLNEHEYEETFNPASSKQIIELLKSKYGWVPKASQCSEKTGNPSVNEKVLETLNYPEAQLITKYRYNSKLLGVLINGKDSWISHVRNGRIYGNINTCGTVTGRMSHYSPNLGNISNTNAYKGKECRELFKASEGKVLVGCDAKAIQPRAIASLLYDLDGGKMVNTILTADLHTENAKKIFLSEEVTNQQRSKGKELFLAYCFGASTGRFKEIMNCSQGEAKRLMDIMKLQFTELHILIERIRSASKRGYLIGLDKRRIPVRCWEGTSEPKAAFNTLIQNYEAVIMKKALCIMYDEKPETQFLLNVHDEIVIECKPEVAESLGSWMSDCMKRAGEYYNLKCPIEGEFKIGLTWYSVH